MIPKKYTGEMLKGRKARCLCDISNKGGHGISAGSTVTIVNIVRGNGQYAYITGVSRNELELIEEGKES